MIQIQSKAITSRGCAKAFIVCVLNRALEFVKDHQNGVSFPFSPCIVDLWLELAKKDCCAGALNSVFYGTEFNLSDVSTYWIDSQQYFTWWKNNVERKCKFLSLVRDASYEGGSSKMKKRTITSLAENIRNYFDRHRDMAIPVPQLQLPMDLSLIGLHLRYYTTLIGSSINTSTNCYECNYMTIKHYLPSPNDNVSKQDIEQDANNLSQSLPNNVRMYRFSHRIPTKKRDNHKKASSSRKIPKVSSSGCQQMCFGNTGSNVSTNLTAEPLLHCPMIGDDDDEVDASVLGTPGSSLDESWLDFTDLFTDDGYWESMNTHDMMATFPDTAINTPTATTTTGTATTTTFACRPMTPLFDETLDISDIDFDALICEGSEVDWIDDCASDCETTDAESSFNSHNNSFYQQYDSEEARRPFPYSSTSSCSSNNSNNSSFGNMNEYFSKKLTLKRSFGNFTNDHYFERISNNNK